MRVKILSVGKLSKSEEATLVTRYERRMRRFKIETIELPEKGNKALEAAKLLSKLNHNDIVMALDERGKMLNSMEFANCFQIAEQSGRNICIVIGGPEGLDPSIHKRANHVLGFGAMTWPHQLVRVMLAEQLYRAETILNGHPYHRE